MQTLLKRAARQAGYWSVAAALSVASATASPAPLQLPDMGSSDAEVLTADRAKAIGAEVVRDLRRQGALLDDPEINRYISRLGLELVGSGRAGSPSHYTFFVVDSPTINAFALPGGFVGINTGLITATRDESELAGVVAHEVAHVSQRHLARSFEKAKQANLPTTAAVIAAILLGSQNPGLSQAALAGALAAQSQLQLDFTRDHEAEADRIGIELLAGAGYDPAGMPAFFERLQQETRYYENGAPEFLRTHPVTSSRLAETSGRAKQLQAGTGRRNSLDYELVRAELRARDASDPSEMVRELGEREEKSPAERYQLAVAAYRAGDEVTARRVLKGLLERDPGRIAYIRAMAVVEIAADAPERALALYRAALARYPDNSALALDYAEATLSLGDAADARRILNDHLRAGPAEPALAYELLARIENRLGNTGAAYLALAEHYVLRGEPRRAIEHLLQAESLSDIDEYTHARIQARIEELKAAVGSR